MGTRAQALRPSSSIFPNPFGENVSRELDWKWSSPDLNQFPRGLLASKAVALFAMPHTGPATPLAIQLPTQCALWEAAGDGSVTWLPVTCQGFQALASGFGLALF